MLLLPNSNKCPDPGAPRLHSSPLYMELRYPIDFNIASGSSPRSLLSEGYVSWRIGTGFEVSCL
jgi:hypothetical protein